MHKFGLRKNSSYSIKSDEEMNANQEDSVQQLRIEATQACSNLAEGVEQLRNETSQACSEIVSGVSQSFVSKEDLQSYHQEVLKKFNDYDQVNKEILSSLESLKKATLYFKHELTNRQQTEHSNSKASTSIVVQQYLKLPFLFYKLMIMPLRLLDMITIMMLS